MGHTARIAKTERTPIVVQKREETAKKTDKTAQRIIGGCLTIPGAIFGGVGTAGGIFFNGNSTMMILSGGVAIIGGILILIGGIAACQKSQPKKNRC